MKKKKRERLAKLNLDEYIRCSCCGKLILIEEVYEDGLCEDCYYEMFGKEW